MKKLYMISLGGKAKGANIEVHDVQFVVGESIEDTIELVKSNWYGIKEKLHIDSYKEIKGADGYNIKLSKVKQDNNFDLYFTCLGDYSITSTQERHEAALVVCSTEEEAEAKALNKVKMEEVEKHTDNIVKVEDIILSTDNEKYYLSYEATNLEFDLSPDWFGYKRIDK